MRDVSGMSVVGVGHPRSPTLFLGEECVPVMRDERFRKNSDYLLKHLFSFIFYKL
jgi:hypothetical protein